MVVARVGREGEKRFFFLFFNFFDATAAAAVKILVTTKKSGEEKKNTKTRTGFGEIVQVCCLVCWSGG